MRCRNCHTVMMETDPECPVCHASAASATAAAPGPFNDNKPGLGMMLPIFGGAIGGAIYAGIKIANASSNSPGWTSTWDTAPSANRSTSSASPLKWLFAILLILVGGLFLLAAIVNFFDTWKVSRWEPKVVSAAQLCKTDGAKAAPAPWLAYTFEESKPTDVIVMRRRLGKAGDVKAQCLLVRVQEKWLLATVPSGFEGNQLVGRLVPLESPPQQVVEKIRGIDPKQSVLLPFEFNAVDGSASDQRQRFITAAVLAFFGLLALFLGVWLIRGKRRPAQHTEPAPVKTGSSFLPLSNG